MTAVQDARILAASDQPDYSGSCMIALYPPGSVARKLAVTGGLPAAEMHLTIAYTGDAADVDAGALAAVAQALASRPPIEATISGHARFTGGDDGDVIVALVDSPDLEGLRGDARDALTAQGIEVPSEHGFTPHITICYQDSGDPDAVGRIEAFPVTFGAITATHGQQRTDCPFAEPEGWDALREVIR